MEKLSLILWRERELLETLEFRLGVEQMVMAAGRTSFLGRAAKEVEQALDAVRQTELLRAVAADAAAAELGLDPNPSLSSLIATVDEPWSSILADHRDAFASLSAAILDLADTNRSLISTGLRAVQETLLGLGGGMHTYSPTGTAVLDATSGVRVDRSL